MKDHIKLIDAMQCCINTIDYMTDDLLEIADVLEEHQINVKIDDGLYLNPASAIRSKVDIITDEVRTIVYMINKAVEE